MSKINELKNEVIAELRAEKEAAAKATVKNILTEIIEQQRYIAKVQKYVLDLQKQLNSVEIEEIVEKDLI